MREKEKRKTKIESFLIISHAGCGDSDRTPYSKIQDIRATTSALVAIKELKLEFDLVICAPGLIGENTASTLAKGVKCVYLEALREGSEHMDEIMPFFMEHGMNPDMESAQKHKLVPKINSLSNKVCMEIIDILPKHKTKSTLIILFPPITQLIIHGFISSFGGMSMVIGSITLGGRYPSCEGYYIAVEQSRDKTQINCSCCGFPRITNSSN